MDSSIQSYYALVEPTFIDILFYRERGWQRPLWYLALQMMKVEDSEGF